MKIVQVQLHQPIYQDEKIIGYHILTTWVDKHPKLKLNSEIELKGKEGVWIVAHLYDSEHDYDEFDFHRKWDNNNYDKHKGLNV